MCQISGFCSTVLTMVSVMTLAVISFNRLVLKYLNQNPEKQSRLIRYYFSCLHRFTFFLQFPLPSPHPYWTKKNIAIKFTETKFILRSNFDVTFFVIFLKTKLFSWKEYHLTEEFYFYFWLKVLFNRVHVYSCSRFYCQVHTRHGGR